MRNRSAVLFLGQVVATAILVGGGCYFGNHDVSDGGPQDSATDNAVLPFQADPPNVYVAKVKNLLIGLPPTDAELAVVQNDPTQLRSLIQSWIQYVDASGTTPYQTKMMRFFQLAFQQTQISYKDIMVSLAPKIIAVDPSLIPFFTQNVQESFARTMLMLTAQNQPLTQAMTTHQFAMTTALKEFYGYIDNWQVNDAAGNPPDTDRIANIAKTWPTQTLYVTAQTIPIADSADPTNPNFMHWTNPNVATLTGVCKIDPITYAMSAFNLHYVVTGSIPGYKVGNTSCGTTQGTPSTSVLTPADFADWQLVTVRTPQNSEPITPFWDVAALRKATELVYQIPRVGFFTTPAFFANWQTNASNQMRVTMNQAFIVATGAQIDGADPTQPPGNAPPLDTAHVAGPCVACHQLLDPSRSILSATYSWFYHNQDDTTLASTPSMFIFQGKTAPMTTIDDLGSALATHPLVGSAWVQKLCLYANSAPCNAADPEFKRILDVFTTSNYSWNTLIVELLSSPIVTNASSTLTAQTEGETVAVSRRDHLCAALNERLGFSDVCGLNALKPDVFTKTMNQIAAGLPSDGYGRGTTMPNLPNAPNLFYRAATEDMCEAISVQVIDVPANKQIPGVKQWSSATPALVADAIGEFVTLVNGLPSTDPRYPQALTLLQTHYNNALAADAGAKVTPTTALESTFAAACIAPSAVSIGM